MREKKKKKYADLRKIYVSKHQVDYSTHTSSMKNEGELFRGNISTVDMTVSDLSESSHLGCTQVRQSARRKSTRTPVLTIRRSVSEQIRPICARFQSAEKWEKWRFSGVVIIGSVTDLVQFSNPAEYRFDTQGTCPSYSTRPVIFCSWRGNEHLFNFTWSRKV